jgi:anti-sigma factor RsiW
MTKPLEPHELSGLLDGELDPNRAAEVRRAVDADTELRAEFDHLSTLDRAWSLAAARAAFRPKVILPTSRGTPTRQAVALALSLAVLLAIRFLPKMMDFPLAFAVAAHAPVLAGLIAGLIWTNRNGNQPWTIPVQGGF